MSCPLSGVTSVWFDCCDCYHRIMPTHVDSHHYSHNHTRWHFPLFTNSVYRNGWMFMHTKPRLISSGWECQWQRGRLARKFGWCHLRFSRLTYMKQHYLESCGGENTAKVVHLFWAGKYHSVHRFNLFRELGKFGERVQQRRLTWWTCSLWTCSDPKQTWNVTHAGEIGHTLMPVSLKTSSFFICLRGCHLKGAKLIPVPLKTFGIINL